MGKTEKADKSVAVFKAAGGRCFVFGLELDPLDVWHVEDGVLLSPAAKKLKRGRSLEGLRTGIIEEFADAQAAAEEARVKASEAEARYVAVKAALGNLLADGKVRFAGELAT